VSGAKLTGIAVHIGARIAALARGGEVLVSNTVKDLVAGSGLRFADRGVHSLKGVPGESISSQWTGASPRRSRPSDDARVIHPGSGIEPTESSANSMG
jgi:class 3 adenylate cyclase